MSVSHSLEAEQFAQGVERLNVAGKIHFAEWIEANGDPDAQPIAQAIRRLAQEELDRDRKEKALA